MVNITSRAVVFNFFYGTVPQEGQGSGFILDKAGHVLTNYHVVEGANRGVEVKLSNKRSYKATVIGSDKVHDLALLKIDAPELQPVVLADSSQIAVGEKVYAIGNPFGLSGTMTQGIISSIRSIRNGDGAPIEDAIQTDAAINPGNSGGPLLNSHGEVIGINTMIASNGAEQSSGIGFAIPINTAKAVLSDLTRYGQVRGRPWESCRMRSGRNLPNRWVSRRIPACSSRKYFLVGLQSVPACGAAMSRRTLATNR